MEEVKTTCQICGRPTKAKKGLIAHHGYTRPSGGWQTASCLGARHLPYEESCDMLPPTIQYIKDYIVSQENRIKDLMANPPEKFTVKTGGYYSKNTKEVMRPADFDPKKETYARFVFDTYENEFHHHIRDIEHKIKYAKIDQKFMEDRLAAWVPPKKE